MSRLARHWPEYLIEAGGLGVFMLGAGLTAVLLESPASPVPQLMPHPALRRAVFGVAMGAIVVALVYSPWGKRSGAHFNPAVTIGFCLLGKVHPVDAASYVLAQFAGGSLGVVLVAWLCGGAFTGAPVAYIATQPGAAGPGAALGAEFAITLLLFLTVLTVSNTARLARFTGLAAAALVALYITIEAPVSGMSMNPARSFASAAPGMLWAGLWIYFVGPLAGTLAAASLYRRLLPGQPVRCAKLLHPLDVRCIHCGYQPRQS